MSLNSTYYLLINIEFMHINKNSVGKIWGKPSFLSYHAFLTSMMFLFVCSVCSGFFVFYAEQESDIMGVNSR